MESTQGHRWARAHGLECRLSMITALRGRVVPDYADYGTFSGFAMYLMSWKITTLRARL